MERQRDTVAEKRRIQTRIDEEKKERKTEGERRRTKSEVYIQI